MSALRDFVAESNAIEGIYRDPTDSELGAHEEILCQAVLRLHHLEAFVEVVAANVLRRQAGHGVIVGGYRAPPGGPQIAFALGVLLEAAHNPAHSPHATHVRFELLHPFGDGNGRAGRVLWAWQTIRQGRDPFLRPFLQTFYYDTLAAARQ